jgi:hypothetical protein
MKALLLKGATEAGLDTEAALTVLTRSGRADFMEVCCSPQSVLAEECIKLGGNAVRIHLASGYDLSTRHGIERAKQEILKQRPRESWISLPCTL